MFCSLANPGDLIFIGGDFNVHFPETSTVSPRRRNQLDRNGVAAFRNLEALGYQISPHPNSAPEPTYSGVGETVIDFSISFPANGTHLTSEVLHIEHLARDHFHRPLSHKISIPNLRFLRTTGIIEFKNVKYVPDDFSKCSAFERTVSVGSF
jgi:hypothetical protein